MGLSDMADIIGQPTAKAFNCKSASCVPMTI